MSKRDPHYPEDEDDIIVERSNLGGLGVIALALALFVALLGLLHYFDLLPI